MNPDDGNIYTSEQAVALGLEFKNLLPLDDELEAKRILQRRRSQVEKLVRKKRLKAQRQARRENR